MFDGFPDIEIVPVSDLDTVLREALVQEKADSAGDREPGQKLERLSASPVT